MALIAPLPVRRGPESMASESAQVLAGMAVENVGGALAAEGSKGEIAVCGEEFITRSRKAEIHIIGTRIEINDRLNGAREIPDHYRLIKRAGSQTLSIGRDCDVKYLGYVTTKAQNNASGRGVPKLASGIPRGGCDPITARGNGNAENVIGVTCEGPDQ